MCLTISTDISFVQSNHIYNNNKYIIELNCRRTQENFRALLKQFHIDFYEKNSNNNDIVFIESARQKYFPILNINDIDKIISRIEYISSYVSYDNNNVCENHKIFFDKEYILTFQQHN